MTPAHLLLLPLDNYKLLNFLNFNDLGTNMLNEPTAFKKIKMFSKTFTNNLNLCPQASISKYNGLTALCTDSSLFTDSYLYGLKRQHNFLNSKALSNNSQTFLDLKSVDQMLTTNWALSSTQFKTYTNTETNNFFNQVNQNQISASTIFLNKLFYQMFPSPFFTASSNLYLYPSLLTMINNDTDKKKLHYPMLKLFQLPVKRFDLSNETALRTLFTENDFGFVHYDKLNGYFNNEQFIHKTYTPFSSNQSFISGERNIRHSTGIIFGKNNSNLTAHINSANFYFNQLITKLNVTPSLISKHTSTN